MLSSVRKKICKDVTHFNMRVTQNHIWRQCFSVYMQSYLDAQIKLKKHKSITEELSEID